MINRTQLSGYPVRDYDELIAALDRARTRLGVTQDQVAWAMGYSGQPSGHNVLAGKRQPPCRRLFALADALGFDLALVPRDGDEHEPDRRTA